MTPCSVCQKNEGRGTRNECPNCRQKRYSAENPSTRRNTIRKYNFKIRYGITPEEYDRMSASQGDVCALCRKVCDTGRSLSVDHDHVTGKVRSLLCKRCNTGLGNFNEDVELLTLAIAYIGQHRT